MGITYLKQKVAKEFSQRTGLFRSFNNSLTGVFIEDIKKTTFSIVPGLVYITYVRTATL